MEKRIALEKRGRTEDQIKELNLDNCRSTSIEGLTDAFSALESLSLINVGLTSLKNFPKLRSLRKLELSDNRISNGLGNITVCESIKTLNLSGNRIKEIAELLPLGDLKELEVLDLFNNEVTQIQNYREKVFDAIKSLKYLDGYDKNMTEAPSDAEDDGNAEEDDDDYGEEGASDNDDDSENGLAAIYDDQLEDDSDEYQEEEEEDENDDEEEEENGEENETRGTKRKIDNDE